MAIEDVAARFGLGRPVCDAVRVTGGLSNELWKLVTTRGVFAVKRMVVNADRPDFVGNVEAAYAVECRAWAAGIAMPEPMPHDGRALAEVGGALFRVHRWVDGTSGEGTAADAANLLRKIHEHGDPRWEPTPAGPWAADGWGPDLAELGRRVAPTHEPVLVVDSHRDLDRKNTLLRVDGMLLALDGDAAGPVGAVCEAVGLALDWSGDDTATFAEALRAYGRRVPPEPWVFGGWVEAQGGWLDYVARHREDQVDDALARLRGLAERIDAYLAAIPD
ncbi:phosphotransferase [Asanoa iriomotensis]|uniref:Aminoglycoside phosphotransferase domain-containing protein n=1 Tax=Asanoa iriomotensis TaxID=234613 RepID=A0ABQ4CAE9_9ACTN|nr:phosphotransferase [Asanoa iriomotensis]GIF59742.1 hypothetical protein Air01nite_58370 [Asanoa iriomotensis]